MTDRQTQAASGDYSDAYLAVGKDAFTALVRDPFGAFAWCVVSMGRVMTSAEFNRKRKDRGR